MKVLCFLLLAFLSLASAEVFDLSATALCRKWHRTQPNPAFIVNSLPPCQPQLTLGRNGRFPSSFAGFKQDGSCNPANPLQCVILHRGARGCYRSIQVVNGSGQQCCYSDQGKLLVGYPGGGTLDVAHSDDVFAHFQIDVYPFFLCCKLSENCNLYYEKRPSDNGTRWTP